VQFQVLVIFRVHQRLCRLPNVDFVCFATDLPEVMSARPEVANMITQLLGGGTESSSVAISSTTKSKVATHGQGGVGKTTMAILTVHNEDVRRLFDRIGWVSVGQTPAVMTLQQALYRQLTDETMEITTDATIDSQCDALQKACKGKHLLVVLDDVWDAKHEKALNCIDEETKSRLLVTSRIRGLVKGSSEVSLDLMSSEEAVDLVLRTGEVEDPTQDDVKAAEVISIFCDRLPLYLGICGSMIVAYDGDQSWHTELVDMLRIDRVGVMNEEDSAVESVVESSLKMLKDDHAEALFMSLGFCPEDVPIPIAAVQLIFAATGESTSSALAIRRSVKKLLDRNLLSGSIAEGVTQHDIVRDFVRSKLGGESVLREKQRLVVNAIAAASPASGWQGQEDALGWYVEESLLQHMLEAMVVGDAKHEDTEAHGWLDHSEDVLEDHFVKCAASCLGVEVIMKLAEQHEAEGELWLAAKRLTSAALTVLNSSSFSNSDQDNILIIKKAAELLTQAPQTTATRTFEVALRLRVSMQLGWNDPWNAASLERIGVLVDAGVTMTSMDDMWRVGAGLIRVATVLAGYFGSGASNRDDIAALERAFPRFLNGPLRQAAAGLENEDCKLICYSNLAYGLVLPQFKAKREWVQATLKVFTHERITWMVHTYDFKVSMHRSLVSRPRVIAIAPTAPQVHHPLGFTKPVGICNMIMNGESLAALLHYGDWFRLVIGFLLMYLTDLCAVAGDLGLVRCVESIHLCELMRLYSAD
jgi:hypothetical protein